MMEMNTNDIAKSSKASDHSTSEYTVPIISLPMPMVSTLVRVDAGVNRPSGTCAALPITI